MRPIDDILRAGRRVSSFARRACAWARVGVCGFVALFALCPIRAFAVAQAPDALRWRSEVDGALREAASSGRPVLVYFADDRAFTKRLDRALAASAAFRARVGAGFIPLRLVYSRERTARDVESWMRRFRVRGFPTLGLITRRGHPVVEVLSGAQPMAAIDAWLDRVTPLCDRFDAQHAYHAKRYGEARAWFAPYVERRDPLALTFVGKMMIEGWGADAEPARGAALLERAIDAGSVDAKRVLGGYLARGHGVKRDPARGYALLREADARGNPRALAGILALLRSGYEPTDGRTLRSWLERAAVLDRDTDRMIELADVLLAPAKTKGGGAKDIVAQVRRRLDGRRWLVHAAVFGSTEALARLKRMAAADASNETLLVDVYLRMAKPPVDPVEIKRIIDRRLTTESPLRTALLARYYAKPGPEQDVAKARSLAGSEPGKDHVVLAHGLIGLAHDEDKRRALGVLHGLVAWKGAGAAEAFWRVEDLARRGDGAAQVAVAAMHDLALHPALHSPGRGRAWLERAYRGGHHAAGTLLAEREVRAGRTAEAVRLLREARKRGSRNAVAVLGRVLALHGASDAAKREGVGLLGEATRDGIDGAAIDLARCHLRGIAEPNRAAWAWARLEGLGKRLRFAPGVARLKGDVFFAKRPSRAAVVLRAVIEAYGRMFHGPSGKAAASVEAWAAEGDGDALWACGVMHAHEGRRDEALAAWRRGMKSGHGGAAFCLARALVRDANEATSRLAKLATGVEARRAGTIASRATYPGAITLFGDIVANGVGGPADVDAAARHYWRAWSHATAPDPAARERLFALWKKSKRPVPTLLMSRAHYRDLKPPKRDVYLDAVFRSLQTAPSKAFANEVVSWLESIAKDDPHAALLLYLVCRDERLEPDAARAVRWLRHAVAGNERLALAHLAQLCRTGLAANGKTLVARDVRKAERLYRRSIAAGAGGMGGLALVLYEQKRRKTLYDLALPLAKKGDAEAMLGVSMVFIRSPKTWGGGPAQDRVEGYAWAFAANLIDGGKHGAQIAPLAKKLSPAERAAGERRAREIVAAVKKR